MRFATFTHHGFRRIGVIEGDVVVDLTAAAPDLPHEMVAFLNAGPLAMDAARAAAARPGHRLHLDDVRLEAPIARPPEFLAIGLNYADHAAEAKLDPPSFPIFFNKQSSCVNAPFDPIHMPRVSTMLDYEGELGFVIGRRARHVSRERAHEVVAGFLGR